MDKVFKNRLESYFKALDKAIETNDIISKMHNAGLISGTIGTLYILSQVTDTEYFHIENRLEKYFKI